MFKHSTRAGLKLMLAAGLGLALPGLGLAQQGNGGLGAGMSQQSRNGGLGAGMAQQQRSRGAGGVGLQGQQGNGSFVPQQGNYIPGTFGDPRSVPPGQPSAGAGGFSFSGGDGGAMTGGFGGAGNGNFGGGANNAGLGGNAINEGAGPAFLRDSQFRSAVNAAMMSNSPFAFGSGFGFGNGLGMSRPNGQMQLHMAAAQDAGQINGGIAPASFAPAQQQQSAAAMSGFGVIEFRVPEGAQLALNGRKMETEGSNFRVAVPNLSGEQASIQRYTVTWSEGDEDRTYSEVIPLMAGDHKSVTILGEPNERPNRGNGNQEGRQNNNGGNEGR